MDKQDLVYILSLSYIKGIGSISARKLIRYFGSAFSVFQATDNALIEVSNIGSYIVNQIKKEKNKALELAEKELKFAEENNINVLGYQSPEYSKELKNCPDAPLILFSKGNIDTKNRKIVSIVGTRNMTAYGKSFIASLVSDLKPYNPIIISGLALGCDAAAHIFALKNGLQTFGILAHGLNKIYPPQHKKIAQNIMENGGLLTEFSSFHNPLRENFLKRNRIIAGMSQATIVVESARRGGAITTARAAFDYNKEVMALPGRTTDTFSQGCNFLIKSNISAMITSGEDLVRLLNWKEKGRTESIQKSLFVELKPIERIIYDHLNANGSQSADQLCISLNIAMPTLSAELLNMELKGVIKTLSGKIYELS